MSLSKWTGFYNTILPLYLRPFCHHILTRDTLYTTSQSIQLPVLHHVFGSKRMAQGYLIKTSKDRGRRPERRIARHEKGKIHQKKAKKYLTTLRIRRKLKPKLLMCPLLCLAISLAGRAAQCCPKAISALFSHPIMYRMQTLRGKVKAREELDTNARGTLGIDGESASSKELSRCPSGFCISSCYFIVCLVGVDGVRIGGTPES